MADEKLQLTVQVNAETGQLEVLGAKFKETGEKARDVSGSFSKLGGEAGNLLRSFLPFATAGGIVAFFSSAVKGAEEQNEAFRKLNSTLGIGRGQVEAWTQAVANSTRFSDGEAVTALEKLARVTGSLGQAQAASKLAMDLSVSSNMALSESTALVTDLLNGNDRALKQVNKEFANVAGSAKTTQEALDLLTTGYKGAAERSTGLTDSSAKLKNSFDQVKDSVGSALIPALTWLSDTTASVIRKFEAFSLIVANLAAKATVNFGTGWREGIAAIDAETERQFAELYKKSTATLQDFNNERVVITAEAANKKRIDQDRADAEELEQLTQQKIKLAQLESQYAQEVAAMSRSTLTEKTAALTREYEVKRQQAAKLNMVDKERNEYVKKLNALEIQQKQKLAQDEVMLKTSASLTVAGLAVQTLQVMNSLGEEGNSQERARAKALLALQQAIAIGWAWVNAQKAGPMGHVIAAAETALIVANFAQQSKLIDQSGQRKSSGTSGVSINPSVPGIDLGSISPDTAGGSFGGFGGGGGGGGGSSGGGGSVVINNYNSINIDIDKLGIDNIDNVMREISERVRQGTTEGSQLALSLGTQARKGANLVS